MSISLTSLPIFIIILVGYIAGRTQLFNQAASDDLARLVFYIVMPVTLFIEIAKLSSHSVLVWPFMGTFFCASLMVSLISFLVSKHCFKRSNNHLIINTMASSHTNTAYIALPLFLLLFHTIWPVASIIIVQSIFNFIFIFLLDTQNNSQHKKHVLSRTLAVFWRNPILIGIILGLAFSFFQLSVPTVVNNTFDIAKQAAAFLALFALGLSLSFIKAKSVKNEFYEIGFLILLKTSLHPLVAFLLGYFIFQLQGFNLFAVVFIAAMPTAKNLFIFAKRYHAAEDSASLIVFMTTLVSIFSLNLILFLRHYLT